MFGAPAGAGRQAEPDDLAGLEALFLFSVHPLDIEGVDEIRNRGWRAGRAEALAVAGPEGTGALVDGLNAAYEQPDAISFIEDEISDTFHTEHIVHEKIVQTTRCRHHNLDALRLDETLLLNR